MFSQKSLFLSYTCTLVVISGENELFHSFALYFSVLQLMNLTDSRLAQAGNEKLELAMLSFFEQFRKIYIGDQVQKSSKVITAKFFNDAYTQCLLSISKCVRTCVLITVLLNSLF